MKRLFQSIPQLILSSLLACAVTLSGCGGGGGGGGGSTTTPGSTPSNVASSLSSAAAFSSPSSIVASSLVASSSALNLSSLSNSSSLSSSASNVLSSSRSSSSSLTNFSSSQKSSLPVVAIDGIVSYKRPTTKTDESNPTHYQHTIVIDAFDVITKEPLSISNLPENSIDLLASDGVTILGTQTHNANSISCSEPALLTSYDALMLFDRSGSMNDNDPTDDSLEAAREFVTNVGNNDGVKIAQFSGIGSSGVYFFNTSFSNDITYLQTLIDAIDSPSGGTPLWDSMIASLNEFSISTNQKALLTFSDGEDTDSRSNSYDVKASAISAGVKVYSINLRNSNTQLIDEIAFSTGGNVFSTDDAKKLIDYYGILGNLLSGYSSTCTVTIDIDFTPAPGIGEVGYGPAGAVTIDTPLSVSLPNNGGSGQITTAVQFPLYPGRKIGQTMDGTSIYEQDNASASNANECLSAVTSGVTNNCVEPIYAAICETGNVNNCSDGLIASGARLLLPSSSVNGISNSACPWDSQETTDQYVPAMSTGNIPNYIYTINKPNAGSYSCINARRFGL